VKHFAAFTPVLSNSGVVSRAGGNPAAADEGKHAAIAVNRSLIMSKMFLACALSTKTLIRVAFAVVSVSLAGMAHAQSTHAGPADGTRSASALQGQNPMGGGGG
jgi:hypothetical protein